MPSTTHMTDALRLEQQADALLGSTAPDDMARLRAELDILRQENQRLTAELSLRDRAMDAAPSQFGIVRQAGPESTIVYCNRAMATQFGLNREQMVGRPASMLVPNWSIDEHKRLTERLRAGETVRIEEEIQLSDGTPFIAGVTILPLFDEQGHLTHSMSIGANITARVMAERRQRELQDKLVNEMQERERIAIELRLAQKLESVGRLAAGVAHEINTPIQFVSDSLYFLRSSFEDLTRLIETCMQATRELDTDGDIARFRQSVNDASATADLGFLMEEMPKAFERTFEGAQRVTRIVRAMKEFAHPDSSEQSPADINHALQTTLIVAANEYKYCAAMKTEFGELPEVVCNIGEINQVFLNLIINAAHAIQDAERDAGNGGEIAIRTALVGEYVEISISDNGCGIPQEHLDKIYDPFFTTKEVGRGTGQGLAITHSIVMDKHQGQVRAESKVGVGTTFTLCLPVNGVSRPDTTEQAV